MEEKCTFDSLLGGTQDLPETVNLLKFTAARSREIQSLKHSLKTTKTVKLAFQKLPKHMRRRVMSHNARRLPRRLREIHLSQLNKSGMPPKQKRPSRKYRRRPRNIVEEFNRRQNKISWLETHVWHAKRFHVINKWGYRLPDRPCDKSFRACYRATAKHCLLQDISYVSCIELSGSKEALVKYLKQICNPHEGLGIGAKAYINGKREGVLTFYDNNKRKAIGPVSFLWKPTFFETDKNAIWIWVHAAFYNQVLNVLIDLFNLKIVEDHYFNKELNVELKQLKKELNRFRLTGPLSQSVLMKTLEPVQLHNNNSEWLKLHLENDEYRQTFAEQIDYWKNVRNNNLPALLPPNIIVSLIVSDPRYMFPAKRSKALPEGPPSELNENVATNICAGPIWDANVRSEVKKSKISNAEFAELRTQVLVPGTELEQPGAPVPIMIIQRPGQSSTGYCSGWDLIIPSGWAQPFWMCLVLWGARAGGLRETKQANFELGKLDLLQPDTEAGVKEDEEVSAASTSKFFRLPPNKRTNFNKFRISSPFQCNWKTIISDWADSTQPVEEFFVLRDKKILESFQVLLKDKKRRQIPVNHIFTSNCLIPVKLTMTKGVYKRFSIICLPKLCDFKKLPTEKIIEDRNQEKRKILRASHKVLLKRLKRKRHNAKKLGNNVPEVDLHMLKKYQEEMRALWLPPVENLRYSSSREIMGFVTKGDFSYIAGQSSAVGYIAVGALKVFLEQPLFGAKVLVRRTNSRQYRLPDRPCDKSFRACYRATAKHCLLQDISYVSCIELSGSKEALVKYLKQICNPHEGLGIGAEAYINGKREGVLTFYDNNKRKAIGPVSFLWKPTFFETDKDAIWIWVHAAFYNQVLNVLIDLFNLKIVEDHYFNKELNVELKQLKKELNRFRLTGPLSQSVLMKTLEPVQLHNNNSEWLKLHLENDEYRQTFAEQIDYWKNVRNNNSPALLPPNIIVSLIVSDPRYMFPAKRSKALPEGPPSELNENVATNICAGPIWDANVRSEVKKSKISNAEFAELRTQVLVPGTELEQPGAPVPIMIIQRPGQSSTGYCSGWDLIIPSGWAQPFWMCLVLWGARAGGLRETKQANFELGKLDLLQPDTEAGVKEDEEVSAASTSKFFRLPPNKRTNYNKFRISSPFQCNWKTIISDWADSTQPVEEFFVLRDKKILESFQVLLKDKKRRQVPVNHIFTSNCLIPVKLTMTKGVYKRFSIICLPKLCDFKKAPTEKIIEDRNQEKRKILRASHKVLLKRLKRKRHSAKKLGNNVPEVDLNMLKKYQEEMRALWLPAVENLRYSSSREIMGFVTKGDFSYIAGQSSAVGYIAVGALKVFLEQPLFGAKVLVRRTNSRQYRLASLDIVT